MPRVLAHLLLSLALVFQGMGVVCAYGPMPPDMANSAATTHTMMGMSQACADSHPCPGCQDKHSTTHACTQNCSLPAGLPSVALFVPHLLLRDSLSLPTQVSLVERIQVPPTPPPIA